MNNLIRLAAAMLLILVTACSENENLGENGDKQANISPENQAFNDVSDLENHPLSPWLKPGGSVALKWSFRGIPPKCVYANGVVNINTNDECQLEFEQAAHRLNEESVIDNATAEDLQVEALYRTYQEIKEAEQTERQRLLKAFNEADPGDPTRNKLNAELVAHKSNQHDLLEELQDNTATTRFIEEMEALRGEGGSK